MALFCRLFRRENQAFLTLYILYYMNRFDLVSSFVLASSPELSKPEILG